MTATAGMVYLVGAGPGDPELITVKGLHLLQQADVIVHDRLITGGLLDHAADCAEIIDVGKAPGRRQCSQEQINSILTDRALRGLTVVRLKGGDPYIFGRGWEEMAACRQAGVPCLAVPGISSALAVPALAGIPLTLRGSGRAFAVVTAQTAADEPLSAMDLRRVAGIETIVVLMGRSRLHEVTQQLIDAGRAPDTPVACIEWGSTPRQRVATGTLATMARVADDRGLEAPVVTVVGDAARHAGGRASRCASPLGGRRIAITRPPTASAPLRHHLMSRGARVVDCPLIDIVYPQQCPGLQEAIDQFAIFDWLIVTSMHGVEGLFRQLEARGLDSRALAGCRIAAIGCRTAQALARRGVRPDVTPRVHTSAGLLEALRSQLAGPASRALLPRSDIAGDELPRGLRALGVEVTDAVVYHTVEVAPSQSQREPVLSGVDAILFYSPSAVRSFVEQGLQNPSAAIGCIGPKTAGAARQAGMDVEIVAHSHDDSGMLQALEDHFERVSPTT